MRPERPDKLTQWLQLRIDHDEEPAAALERFTQTAELRGLLLFGPDPEAIWERFKASYTFVQAAGGVVSDERGRLLAIRRLGVWDLPKGKVDAGEAIDEAAVREVREECGLQVLTIEAPLCHTWHTYERKGVNHLKRTDWFLMNASSAERLVPQEDEAIEQVTWLDAAGLARMRQDTYPSLLSVLDAWEQARRSRT